MQVLNGKSISAPSFYGDIKEIYNPPETKFALPLFLLSRNLNLSGQPKGTVS